MNDFDGNFLVVLSVVAHGAVDLAHAARVDQPRRSPGPVPPAYARSGVAQGCGRSGEPNDLLDAALRLGSRREQRAYLLEQRCVRDRAGVAGLAAIGASWGARAVYGALKRSTTA